MNNKKVKLDQYLVRGKKRNFRVIKMPKMRYVWECWDDCYCYDGDEEAMKYMRYAIAALIADPEVIIYIEFAEKGYAGYYEYEFNRTNGIVITSPENQFRRSEWPRLRRQLNNKNKIEKFCFNYKPELLCKEYEKFESYDRKDKSAYNDIYNNTLFWIVPKYYRYSIHHDIKTDTDRFTKQKHTDITWSIRSYPFSGWTLPRSHIKFEIKCFEKKKVEGA